MTSALGTTWKANRQFLAAGFLLASSLFLLLWYVSWRNTFRGIAESKATGLAAIAGEAWDPISLWQARSLIPKFQRGSAYQRAGVVGGVPGGVAMAYLGGRDADKEGGNDVAPRQIVRTGALQIVSANPAQTAEQLRALAEGLGGFVVKSELSGSEQQARAAQVMVRIPAARFDEARDAVRRLARSVEQDSTEARDVTREVNDQQAQLRNFRAEEAQYLVIMRRATAVKDVLDVSEKLADVRGRIDRLATEMRDLRQQVDMSLLTVGVTAEAEAQVFGVRWRSLYEAKVSLRNALSAGADFANAVVALVLYLPVIVLWALLVLLVLKVGWMALSRVLRVLFPGMPRWHREQAAPQA